MTDYKRMCGWKKSQMQQNQKQAAQAIIFSMLALVLYGFVGYLEQEPAGAETVAAVTKSATQEQLETMLPEPVAKAIAERSAYPRTMGAIAHTESRGNHKAIGDSGKAKGLFQTWGALHGAVPDDIEGQVDQANKMFLRLVDKHGYRKAVSLWNGTPSLPKVQQYQRIVLAKVQEMQP